MGANAEKTVKRAEKRSELWECLFSTDLLFIQAKEPFEAKKSEKKSEETREKAEKRAEKRKRKETQKYTVSPEDPMAFVAHRIFAYQFSQMLAHEKETRKGEDIEDLHDMRVAVRRMRAAAIVFDEYIESEKVEPHIKGLKRTLGAWEESGTWMFSGKRRKII